MLTSKQRGYISSLAATMQPTVMVGKDGLTEGVANALASELAHRELVKLRFVASKDERRDIAENLSRQVGADLVRIIGNIAILYRPSDDPDLRKILLP
jgi:RNA-binding protein